MKTSKKIFYFMKYVVPNPKKFINFFLIEGSRKLKLTKPLGHPHTMLLEPINYCNLKCPLCPTGKGQLGREACKLEVKNFKKIIDDMGGHLVHLRVFGWGEPLLHDKLFEMIRYAKKKKMFVNIHTNAFFLNEENVKEMVDSKMDDLNISLDGASQETYSKYRKQGDFKTTISHIKLLTEEKKLKKTKYPVVNMQFIVMKHNEHEIDKIKQIAKEVGVDRLVLKMVKVDTVEEAEKYMPSKESMRRFKIEGKKLVKTGSKNTACSMLWTDTTIWADGSVVPCCYDYKSNYVFGNAFEEDFKKIWKNSKSISFRKQFLKDPNKIPICKVCPKSGSGEETTIADIKVGK